MKNRYILRLIAVFCLCISLSSARSQYVAIPDSNFGNWLYTHGYTSCLIGNSVSGWQLDTTCGRVQTDTLINCDTSNIHNLDGIQYFRSLRLFYCRFDSLSSLPALPAGLTYLDCTGNQLTSLPALPGGLTTLWCGHSQLTSLPALPAGLTTLYCYENRLTSLPALPVGLTTLACSSNQLTSLPSLPAGLTTLDCIINQLTSLPSLPAGLTILDCYYNQLTSLPALPVGLNRLWSSNNQLSHLPVLPAGLSSLLCYANQLSNLPALPAGLTYLDCSNNQLTSLPSLPAGLSTIRCQDNQLTSLPSLPAGLGALTCSGNQLSLLPTLPAGLEVLTCSGNQLSLLPTLPVGLTTLECNSNPALSCLPAIHSQQLIQFYISGTAIHCLPNRFLALNYDIQPDTMPLCTAGSGCDFYYNIAGNIHQDTSASCIVDSLSPGHPTSNIKVQLKRNGQVIQQFYTFNSGGYSFKTDSLVNYTVTIDTAGSPLSIACPSSAIRSVVLTPTDSVATDQNFGLMCLGPDFASFSINGRFKASRTSQIQINAGLMLYLQYGAFCGNGLSGTVTTTISGSVSYTSPALGALTPSSVSGRTLTYNIPNLDILQPGSFDIMVATDSNAAIGSPVCITAIISPSTPDINPSNDTLTMCFNVVNSWDPNHKDVSPAQIAPGSTDWLTYTIEFQNTGNDTAYSVVVRDTLSANVDAASFQYLASDHKAVIELLGNAMVFTFPKINLVDSGTNPALSTGWIQYRVKPKPNQALGSHIDNTAYIYFDNNTAVVTNTARTLFSPVGFGTELSAGETNEIQLFPNPNKGSFILQTTGMSGNKYIVSDMLGHVIVRQTIAADDQNIDLSNLAEGVYSLQVQDKRPIRFIVVK